MDEGPHAGVQDAKVTVVLLEPAKHRELTQARIAALKSGRSTSDEGYDPVDGELTCASFQNAVRRSVQPEDQNPKQTDKTRQLYR